uniref:Uncharacterized protein n=1 Tax=Peronospora matthiolae TaxID=2874970 RepID=A0AAV1TKI3_9STRA
MQKSMPRQIEDSNNRQTGRTSVLSHKSFLEDLASSQAVLRLPFQDVGDEGLLRVQQQFAMLIFAPSANVSASML